jgi:hypothetical protein
MKARINENETKEGMCTLCKGSGKYEVFCHVGNDFWSGD